jgi:hypothetical protein
MPDDHSGWMQDFETDTEGICSIPTSRLRQGFIAVYQFSIGLRASTLVDFPESEHAPLELLLNPDKQLRVRLQERSSPASGLEVWSEDTQGVRYGLASASTNEDGLATWGPVSTGEYTVQVRQPGYWPSSFLVHIDAAVGPPILQVRRLGSCDFESRDALGNVAPGVEIEMISLESGEALSGWLASGKVIPPTGGARTGPDGILRLNGLPNGLFHWRATSPNGDVVEGEVIVPPSSLGHADISVP